MCTSLLIAFLKCKDGGLLLHFSEKVVNYKDNRKESCWNQVGTFCLVEPIDGLKSWVENKYIKIFKGKRSSKRILSIFSICKRQVIFWLPFIFQVLRQRAGGKQELLLEILILRNKRGEMEERKREKEEERERERSSSYTEGNPEKFHNSWP